MTDSVTNMTKNRINLKFPMLEPEILPSPTEIHFVDSAVSLSNMVSVTEKIRDKMPLQEKRAPATASPRGSSVSESTAVPLTSLTSNSTSLLDKSTKADHKTNPGQLLLTFQDVSNAIEGDNFTLSELVSLNEVTLRKIELLAVRIRKQL